MDLYQLKFPYRKVLDPLAQRLIKINPDWLGYFASFISLLTGLCYLKVDKAPWLFLAAIVLIFSRMTLNTLDGVIAIAQGKKDLRGEIVNALPDRYSDIFLFLGIAFCPYCNPALGVLGLASVFLVSYTGMLGKAIGVNWQHQGPLGKVERLILVMLASFLQYLFIILKIPSLLSILNLAMILFVCLGQVTVFNRLKGVLKEIGQKEGEERLLEKSKAETIVVVYDSQTGNTEKIAEAIAQGLECNSYQVKNLPHPVSYYDLVVFGTPDIRAKPLPAIQELFNRGVYPRSYALFVTFGLPVWGQISSKQLMKSLKITWKGKNLRYLGCFCCAGFHKKYRTHKGRPSEKDLRAAVKFGKNLKFRHNQLSFLEYLRNNLLSFAIKTIGRLSKGISLSFKYGFTSGLMLDYIYKNEPSGSLIIGKWIDKLYLEDPGWQVIRQRKESLKRHLKQAIQENREKGIKTRILDIASGPARYMIETLKETGEENVSVFCQDIDERWAEEGEKIAKEAGIKAITFRKGDAFDQESLAMVSANIAVSSGFYDWITDGELIKYSLKIIRGILPSKGKVILTNQASHFSMDLVKRTFIDFTGKPLVMTTWPIELMTAWLKDIGFRNLMISTDNWGIYSVITGENP